MTMPSVSVVTVVYNGVRGIARTIDSTLAQDHPDMEYIVIDGGSTDGTQAIVSRYGQAIDCFVSEPDHGIYDAMNKGVSLASSEFVLMMNCGDVFASADALSCIAQATVAGVEQAVFGAWERLDERGRRTPRQPSLTAAHFNHQAVLYSRSLHSSFGGYVNVPGFSTADYLFFCTLLGSHSVACLALDTAIAIVDVGGVSAGLQTMSQKVAIDHLFGRASRMKMLAVLGLHPAYHCAKRALRRLR